MEQTDITKLLIPQSDWASPELFLYENEDQLRLDLASAIQFSGINSVGGVVLGFRLVQYAVELTSGNMPLQRDGISIYTSFLVAEHKMRLNTLAVHFAINVTVAIPHCITLARNPVKEGNFCLPCA